MAIIQGGPGADVLQGGSTADHFDGGAGSDTASYQGASRGVVADLAAGSAYKILRFMPLGDSITYGVIASSTDTESGGYRSAMLDQLAAMGVRVDMVGSQRNGPASMSDRDHEGYRGWTINQLDGIDAAAVAAQRPDAVLLIAGTNDSASDSVATMVADLRALLLSLTAADPALTVLVGSLPPVRVGQQPQARADRVDDYNDAMPGLVAELAASGRKVEFVDMRDLSEADITAPPADSGLHPTAAGYGKIATHWTDALREHFGLQAGAIGSDRDTFASIENLLGSAHADELSGDAQANTLTGGAGDDRLDGRDGNDVLDGGSGKDLMTGGAGSDSFFVDDSGDRTVETAGGGIDEAHAFVSWTLPDQVENLFLRSGAHLSGTGNALANTLIGNSGANSLNGLAGNDTLEGRGGNDRLDGGGGTDRLVGGLGNDMYFVDASSDATVEEAGGGSDEVHATLNWTLADQVEKLFLRSGAHLAGTGNAMANAVTGNSGNNAINGLAGDDALDGRGGNDRIEGGLGEDLMLGGTGDDTFVFKAGHGFDTVADFLAGGTEDRVEVSGYAGYTELRQVGADTWVVFAETDMLALLGVQASDLGQNDFVFT